MAFYVARGWGYLSSPRPSRRRELNCVGPAKAGHYRRLAPNDWDLPVRGYAKEGNVEFGGFAG